MKHANTLIDVINVYIAAIRDKSDEEIYINEWKGRVKPNADKAFEQLGVEVVLTEDVPTVPLQKLGLHEQVRGTSSLEELEETEEEFNKSFSDPVVQIINKSV